MATSMRKRGAVFLLEKPLVSRLPFEVEQPFSRTAVPPPKRVKPAATTSTSSSPYVRDEDLDKHPCDDDQGETSEMREVCHREGVAAAVEVEVDDEKGCWLAEARDRRSGGVEHAEEGKELASTGATACNSGGRRALVQLKIDAMFAAPRLAPTKPGDRDQVCSARPGQQSELDVGRPGDRECAGATQKAERGMDVDGVDSDAAGADAGAAGEREGEPSCYACRGGLGTEGGDVLCSFCDRAACQACWQNCHACEVPHCSLCLATDYSSQFECYFCPPCYQDRRLESC